MKTHALLMIICLCTGTAVAQDTKSATPASAAPAVEITAEPSHHLKLDNPHIRVFAVDVGPHQSTMMHHHPYDYIGVAFGHTEIDSVTPDGAVKHVVLEDGDVRYTPAGLTHVVVDQAITPFRNATIELLQNHGHPVCVNKCENDPRGKDWPPLTAESKLIGYGDTFRISEATIKGKQTVSTDEAFPHLVIMLTDLHARVGPEGSGSSEFNQKAADFMFHGGHPDHGLTNLSDQNARLVVIEFKPSKE